MTFGPAPVCFQCARLKDIDDSACEAFPDGIPESIWFDGDPHDTPRGSDGGLTFVPRATAREPLAAIVVPTAVPKEA